MDPIVGDRVTKRTGDVLLADQVREGLRAVFPGEDDVGHGVGNLPRNPTATGDAVARRASSRSIERHGLAVAAKFLVELDVKLALAGSLDDPGVSRRTSRSAAEPFFFSLLFSSFLFSSLLFFSSSSLLLPVPRVVDVGRVDVAREETLVEAKRSSGVPLTLMRRVPLTLTRRVPLTLTRRVPLTLTRRVPSALMRRGAV